MTCKNCTDLIEATDEQWETLLELLDMPCPSLQKLARLLATADFFEES
jgi:uncharacterized protein (DUF1778 family)